LANANGKRRGVTVDLGEVDSADGRQGSLVVDREVDLTPIAGIAIVISRQGFVGHRPHRSSGPCVLEIVEPAQVQSELIAAHWPKRNLFADDCDDGWVAS